MQVRTMVALGLLALAIVLALVGGDAAVVASGAAFLASVGLLASLLPFWARLRPRLPPMPDLAARPRANERWCPRCGRGAPRRGPCPTCGVAAARERRRLRRAARVEARLVQQKQKSQAKQQKAAK